MFKDKKKPRGFFDSMLRTENAETPANKSHP